MNKLAALAVAAAAAFASTAASAALLTQSISHVDSYEGKTNWTEMLLSLPQFDSALGTLSTVTLDYSGSFTSTFRYENLGRNRTTPRQSVSGELSFGSMVLGPETLTTLAEVSQPVSGFDGSVNWGGTGGYTTEVTATDSASRSWLAGTDDLSAFIGTDVLEFVVSAFGKAKTEAGGNSSSSISTRAWASVSITYEFVEAMLPPLVIPPGGTVPEPGSIALLGLALTAAGAASRRRVASRTAS